MTTSNIKIVSPEDGIKLLKGLSAPPKLILHHELVIETAKKIFSKLSGSILIHIDQNLVLIGCSLHDAGKVIYKNEVDGPGRYHEDAGKILLLAFNSSERIASFCITHANWNFPGVGIEDLIVALADCLWKGSRNHDLEYKIIHKISEYEACDFWDLFMDLDSIFEEVASDGPSNLNLFKDRIGISA